MTVRVPDLSTIIMHPSRVAIHFRFRADGIARRWHPLVTGVVTLAAIAACSQPAPPPPPPPPEVTVAAAIGRDVTDFDEFTGRVEAVNTVEIRPRVSGYVQRVAFTEGAEVRKGDVLFAIDPRPYAAELARAQAQLEAARTRLTLAGSEVARAQRLLAAQAISREEFDARTSGRAEGDANVRAAEAALAAARLNLEWTTVRAPISGRVGRAEVTAGNLVQTGPPTSTLLTSVVSMDSMYVYFDGDEQAYLKYVGFAPSAGKSRNATPSASKTRRRPIYVGLANESGFPHEGVLDFVDNRLDPVAGTIRARGIFSNRARLFTPGLFARVKLVGSATYGATLVQDRAIGTDQDKKFVLVLKPDYSTEYRPITVGPMDGGLRIVRGGLAPGEQVVINGLQRVRPGMRVTPKIAPMMPDTTAVLREAQGAR